MSKPMHKNQGIVNVFLFRFWNISFGWYIKSLNYCGKYLKSILHFTLIHASKENWGIWKTFEVHLPQHAIPPSPEKKQAPFPYPSDSNLESQQLLKAHQKNFSHHTHHIPMQGRNYDIPQIVLTLNTFLWKTT